MQSPRINHKIKIVVGSIFLATAAAVSTVAVARADGNVTPQEQAFGDGISASLCNYLDNRGINEHSMYDLMKIIYEDTPSYMDAGDAADIVNYTVYTYCPNHWPALVAFGEGYRAHT